MILYHGSNVEIEIINFLKSKVGKDFGVGFYLSLELEQAQEMVEKKALLFGGEPTLTRFEFDEAAALADAGIFFGTEKALDTLYNSETYTKVLDLRTGLFSQSTVYEDHIYPQASFRTKDLRKRGLSDEAIEQYQSVYNSIANLELLEDSENKSKNATPFDEWIKSREKNFKDRHLIPEINDYGYDHFMEFIEARKKLIKAAIKKAAFEKVDNQEI